jgi:hypothetical protein
MLMCANALSSRESYDPTGRQCPPKQPPFVASVSQKYAEDRASGNQQYPPAGQLCGYLRVNWAELPGCGPGNPRIRALPGKRLKTALHTAPSGDSKGWMLSYANTTVSRKIRFSPVSVQADSAAMRSSVFSQNTPSWPRGVARRPNGRESPRCRHAAAMDLLRQHADSLIMPTLYQISGWRGSGRVLTRHNLEAFQEGQQFFIRLVSCWYDAE